MKVRLTWYGCGWFGAAAAWVSLSVFGYPTLGALLFTGWLCFCFLYAIYRMSDSPRRWPEARPPKRSERDDVRVVVKFEGRPRFVSRRKSDNHGSAA